jgi:Holliday junction resolvase RusA-like endonuclease
MSKTVVLPMPPSSNNAYPSNGGRRGGRHMSKAGKEWRDTVCHMLAIGLRGFVATPPLRMDITLYVPDNRIRDPGSYMKLPVDAISDALGIDDNWHVVPALSIRIAGIDRENPRCEVEISCIEQEQL